MNPVTRKVEHPLSRSVLAAVALAAGCNGAPQTYVSLDNAYPPSKASPTVVYQGWWQAVAFGAPIVPGGSSGLQPTVPASDNTAYVVLAPGWDPNTRTMPTSFVVLRSRSGYSVNLGDTLRIVVDDASFEGDCATGSHLTQDQADIITQLVFPNVFAGLRYDAATCTTTSTMDAAVP